MFDMANMLGKMKDLQAKMKEAQDKLALLTETAEAGAGLVKVTVNGNKRVVRIDIDPDLLKPADREVLQDLVVAATNLALANVEEAAKAAIKDATQGLLPNIPGLDFGL